ncbi:SH3 domain-containing protein [Streptomyces sp. Amel2xC10]|uniref:SH3 domain-containing protein n=1 Tax=Streptomyces sp. Amel2xC10 TaxID=1305826 RepID=UPI000A088072|nr:SH3 domain-containing protein [Streptomyces sp. Amel2xC10]SMF54340.1 SH3 domain-containing protein [Streptomyces sp. Amel2xC10]
MSLRRSALARLAIVTAAATLAASAAVAPAVASDRDGNGNGNGSGSGSGSGNSSSQWGNGNGNGNSSGGGTTQSQGGNSQSQGGNFQHQGGNGGNGNSGNWQSQGGNGGNGGGTQRLYRGRVTADQLLLRSRPTRNSQVIRVVHRGAVVRIFCKTPGQNVQGNPLWYLLTDGTWAWGSARYIDNIGEAPRWC